MTARPQPTPVRHDHRGTVALWGALRTDDPPALDRALAAGANPNARSLATVDGADTALVTAARWGKAWAVQRLLAAGARQTAGRLNQTPLIALAGAWAGLPAPDALASLQALLSKPSGLFKEDKRQSTALERLLSHPDPKAVEPALALLLPHMRRHPWPPWLSASTLQQALDIKHATPAVFDQLVAHGADPTVRVFHHGLARHLVKRERLSDPPKPADPCWWERLAHHHVPPGLAWDQNDPAEIGAHARLAAHRAQSQSEQLEKAWPTPARRAGARL